MCVCVWLAVAITCDHPFLLYFLLTLPSSFGPGDADLALPQEAGI